MKLYKDSGEWSDELLEACKTAGPSGSSIPPNLHPEVLKAQGNPAPYPTTGDPILDGFSKKERDLLKNGDPDDKRTKELRTRYVEAGGTLQ